MMNTLIIANQNLQNKDQIENYIGKVIALFSKGNDFMVSSENSSNEKELAGWVRIHNHNNEAPLVYSPKREGQMLCMVLDIFEHLEIPIIIRWSAKHGRGDADSSSLSDMMDKLGILNQSEYDAQKSFMLEEGTMIYEIIEQESREVLATGTSWSNTGVAAWQFDIRSIGEFCISNQEKYLAIQRPHNVLILSELEFLPASRLLAAELRDAGFGARIKQVSAVSEDNEHVMFLSDSEPRFFIIPGERRQTIGESCVLLKDRLEQTLLKVKMDQAIHLMTQILL